MRANDIFFRQQRSTIEQLRAYLLQGMELEVFLAHGLPLIAEALSLDHIHLWQATTAADPFTCYLTIGTPPTATTWHDDATNRLIEQQTPHFWSQLPPELTTAVCPPSTPIQHGIIAPLPVIAGQRYLLCLYADQSAPQTESQLFFVQNLITLLTWALQQQHTQAVHQTLIEHSAHGLAIIQKGHVVFWNHFFAELLNQDWQVGYAQPFWHILATELEAQDFQDLSSRIDNESFWNDGQPYSRQLCLKAAQGEDRWLHTRISPLEYRGEPACQVALIEITDRQQQLMSLQTAETQLRQTITLREKALDSSVTPFAITNLAGQLKYANKAFVALWEGETAVTILDRPIFSLTHIGEAEEAAVLTANLITHLQQTETWQTELTIQQPNGDPCDLEINATLLYDESNHPLGLTFTFVDVTLRNQQQALLQQNQRRLLDAERLGNMGHWEWDINSGGLYWSDEVYRIFGVHPAEFHLNYHNFIERVHIHDQTKVNAAIRDTLVNNAPYNIEHRIMRPNGEVRIVREQGEVQYDSDGSPVRMLGTVQDITTTQTVAEQSRFQAQVLQTIDDAIITLDAFLTIISWNEAAVRLYGWSAEEAVGQNINDLLQTDFLADENSRTTKQIKRSGSWHGIQEHTTHQGDKRYIQVAISPITSLFNPYASWVTVNRDVTTQHKANRALQSSEAQLQAIFNHSQGGILVMDDSGYCVEANPAAVQLLGYTLNELRHLSVHDIIGPTQATTTPNLWQMFMAQGELNGCFAIVNRQGTMLDVACHAVAKVLPGLHIIFMRDVTQQRQQQLVQQKLTNALEQTADMVLITNKDGIIEYVNHAFTQITGYSRAEVLGGKPSLLKSGRHSANFYHGMWQVILSGEPLRLVLVNRRKNGELYYEDRTITPLLDEKNEITHFIASGRDITAQREAQMALQKSDAFNRAVLNSLPIYVAVLEPNGEVVTTNDAWDQLREANHLTNHLVNAAVGDNYLEVCREATKQFSRDATLACKGLTAVLADEQTQFDLEYVMVIDQQERWFLLRAVPLQNDSGQVIVTHTDITHIKLLERQLHTVYEFGQELVSFQADERLLHRFLQIVTMLFDFDLVAYGLLDADHQTLTYTQRALRGEISTSLIQLPLSHEKGMGVAAIRAGRPLYVPNIDQEPRYVAYADFQAQSAYYIPIRAQKEIIGVVAAECGQAEAFSPNDQLFLDILTQQLGQAIHNARLFAIERHQAQNLALLNRASQTIASSLELPQVLNSLLSEMRTMLDATAASVLLYDEENHYLRFTAVVGSELDELRDAIVWPGKSIAGWVFQHQEPLLINDAQEDGRFSNQIDAITGLTTRSLLAVPLTFGEHRLGVVEILSNDANTFQPHHLQLIQSLSSNAAAAVANARLFATERQLKEHLQQSHARLVQSEKMGALGRLTASIAHEINNPLQSVDGFLTLIEEAIPPIHEAAKLRRYLNIIMGEIDRISQLVRQMRDFYRPAQQEMSLVDVHDILESILLLSNKKVQQQAVTVEKIWDEDLPPVLANPDHLKQVFLNLLLNALDAMPDGGQITIKTDISGLSKLEGVQAAVKVDFIDTGHGIPADVIDHLFEPFFSTKKSGTGLGLSISYNIIEAHGGLMQAESVAGEGATLSVILPIA